MPGSLFDPENTLWRATACFADILTLSLLWLFLSLPLFTLGASTAALYDACVKCVRTGHAGAAGRFWGTFRREFKTAGAATLLWGGVCAALIALVWTLRVRMAFRGFQAALILAAWFAVLLLPVGALCWMFPLLSRFSFSPTRLIATAVRFALGYFPRTVGIVAVALGAVILSGWLLVPMLVLPALTALAWSGLMEGVFQKYS